MFNAFLNTAQNPTETINRIMRERNVSFALFGYAAGALSLMMAASLASGKTSGPVSFAFGFLFCLFFNLCVGFFFASSAHLLLELTTGKGKAAGLFVLLGISEFTKTLLVAFALTALAVPALLPFTELAVLVVLGVQLFFVLFIMQRAYGLSKTGTFLALLASFIPSVISLLAVACMFLVFLFWVIF
jgi:hypothetical protein